MTDANLPNTIVVVDKDGRQHHASRTAPFVVDGLADGSLKEVDDRAPVPAQSDHHDTGSGDGAADSGPGDGERSDPAASDPAGDGVAGTATSRRDRRRS